MLGNARHLQKPTMYAVAGYRVATDGTWYTHGTAWGYSEGRAMPSDARLSARSGLIQARTEATRRRLTLIRDARELGAAWCARARGKINMGTLYCRAIPDDADRHPLSWEAWCAGWDRT
jgi:hypothetical protein